MLPWAVWYLRGEFAQVRWAVLTCMQEGGDFAHGRRCRTGMQEVSDFADGRWCRSDMQAAVIRAAGPGGARRRGRRRRRVGRSGPCDKALSVW